MGFVVGSLRCGSSDRGQRGRVICEVAGGERVKVSRREVLFGAAGLVSLSVGGEVLAEEETSELVWKGPSSLGYTFKYPPAWTATKKQIKTHASEVLVVKDGTSAQVGLVVDPVKINSLKEFGSPEQVADKVLGVEKKKDGTLSVRTLALGSFDRDGLTYYDIEYEVENTRGMKRYISRLTINDKNLYVFTGQAKIADFSSSEAELRKVLSSLYVKKSYNNS
uniref:PsbP C-terminal domain-containing protein n=1 Tax=Rhodosorus marinus TaxID=101924 RepID=A0A7S0BSD6_9RHOD|mmetsp:Transcript_5974/g.8449  ORF Transcript_5974/g.8449 Transcript_5974/m.8449 type:complete len:222 (+) Transcript_5974:166-831(+)